MRFFWLGRVDGVLLGGQHEFGQLDEAWPVWLVEFEHPPDNLDYMLRVPRSDLKQHVFDLIQPVLDMAAPGHIVHRGHLKEHKPTGKNITLVNAVGSMPRIFIHDVSLPPKRT